MGYFGILQPFSDAIKLIRKEIIILKQFNYLYYLISPIFILLLIIIIWLIYPFMRNIISIELGIIYLIFCLRLGGYGLIISGWASNSLYSILGSIRSLSQSISYEVNLSLIILILIIIIERFNFNNFNIIQKNV